MEMTFDFCIFRCRNPAKCNLAAYIPDNAKLICLFSFFTYD